jgi:hypothetical protein
MTEKFEGTVRFRSHQWLCHLAQDLDETSPSFIA